MTVSQDHEHSTCSALEAVLSGLTGNERRVLHELAENGGDDQEWAFGFEAIGRFTGLHRAAVRTACRGLASKGLVVFMRGLMTEDGEVAGSGYSITRAGVHLYWNLPAGTLSSAEQVVGDSSRDTQNPSDLLIEHKRRAF